ncbi:MULTISPECIES: rhodanese-like domain-containing protein [unclassified Mucilaginibacter]|uniref:rhodanese-like domain-containing protein n=1 Tax=unclassified Mucilaginibacter TaxID=2617802 RepID=UPI002AC8C79C|nr:MULTISPECIES: rhodanese-like domain-containing protein [unclassified Mucilaginibacter]MEB0262801.1 rhodanese-like domain-containing protein [Mucilaginibacter sp. 10I4]MEB0278184.1 rhodanese-like domain-containing protein [Mucilaginibacter sp. 10B2]MEB0302066.1 rhodanese-like domain-containing protein [Mucilaginibacter sp. 5C4]WPX23830.1 rhodanese-like domain-containing protein [Mucilaginibacter sp. 5C4]
MKTKTLLTLCILVIAGLCSSSAQAQTSPVALPSALNNYPWTDRDLMAPALLAANIKEHPAELPLILNIGAVEDIKGAKHIGAAGKTENLKALKAMVATLPKNRDIVIYCGCCPFTKCPNIRPAFQELKKMGFTHVKLLNLPVNLQTNWIAKGYPLAGS